MGDPRRIGIAGVGRIGAMHAANVAALDAVEQVLLFDPVPGRAAQAAAALDGAVAVDTVEELLAADGVLIATPTDTHPELVRRAIAADTPVLCEKPLAATTDELEALINDIESAGATVLIGFQRRF